MRRIVLLLASIALVVIFDSGVALADSPTTKEDCKKGGYAKYGFKNQGQCIKAVNHATPADTTAPQTTIDQIDTSNLATNGSVVTHFSSSESNSTFECRMWPMNELGEEIGIPIWEPCSSPKTYEDLGWYSYRFYVRATDAAGNVDETPATQVFEAKVDSIPPDGEITDGPADGAVLNQSSVTYSFQVSDNREIQNAGCVIIDNATGFPYRLPTDDPNGLPSGEKRVCSSPVTFENIPDGNYTFTLYPQDKTFTTDPTPATRTFTVDTTPAEPAGSLDTSFSEDGKLIEPVTQEEARDALLQPDGKAVIVLGNRGEVRRYNADGTPDSSFGNAGSVDVPQGAYSLALQPDGKLLVVGAEQVTVPGGSGWNSVVTRLNPDGSTDTSFGENGLYRFPRPDPNGAERSQFNKVIVQPNGKIVVAGIYFPDANNMAMLAVRLNSDGSPDTTFSDDGWVSTPVPGGYSQAWGAAVRDDGRIVLSGLVGHSNNLRLERYNVDGTLDTSFGGDGIVHGTQERDFTYVDPVIQDGKITVLDYDHATLSRYNADGSLDTSYGANGYLDTPGFGYDIAKQDNGAVLVGGAEVFDPQRTTMVATRVSANGELDAAFGDNGTARPFAPQATDTGSIALAISVRNDKILLAGTSFNAAGEADGVLIAKLHQ